jgi:hypothetical protein
MGVGAIPFTAISDYFIIYNIDGDFHEFASLIRRMDNVYLELQANEVKTKEGNSSGDNTSKKDSSKS